MNSKFFATKWHQENDKKPSNYSVLLSNYSGIINGLTLLDKWQEPITKLLGWLMVDDEDMNDES